MGQKRTIRVKGFPIMQKSVDNQEQRKTTKANNWPPFIFDLFIKQTVKVHIEIIDKKPSCALQEETQLLIHFQCGND